MDIFDNIAGMPGIFLAALFSASLRFVQEKKNQNQHCLFLD
jgi:hypothetical protein